MYRGLETEVYLLEGASDMMETQRNPDAIPVTILTGFLGAGKTTLLNRILSGDHGLKVGVLVNDFGSINIDAELVVGVDEDMISLANGCVCCQIRDDLIDAVDNLIARSQPVEYILLEASGVADPASIYTTFVDSKYSDRIHLDSVTCVVDADQLLYDDNPGLTMLKMRQVACADLVILNKVDLAGPEQIQQVRQMINGMMSRVRIVEAVHCDVPLEILLAAGRFDPAQAVKLPDEIGREVEHEYHHSVDAGHLFSRWSYETEMPLSLEALREMVRRELPGSIYRCKGIVYTMEEPEKRAVLQCVGRRTDVLLAGDWENDTPGTRIVAIGELDGFDPDDLRAKFDACLAERNRTELYAKHTE
jgi:G3E family GTPase